MLEYGFEGYGYDNDDPRLWSVTQGKELQDKFVDGMSTQGMKTYAQQDTVTFNEDLDVVNANDYTELGQFISQGNADYTDLRGPKCNCDGE